MWLVLGEWRILCSGGMSMVLFDIQEWRLFRIYDSDKWLRDFMKPLQRLICLWGAISSTLEGTMTLSAVLSTRLGLASVIELQMHGTLRVYSPCYWAKWGTLVVFAESMSRGKYCYFIGEGLRVGTFNCVGFTFTPSCLNTAVAVFFCVGCWGFFPVWVNRGT